MLVMSPADTAKQKRLLEIVKSLCVRTGDQYTLASGMTSNYYFTMKYATMDPEGIWLIADLVYSIIAKEDFQYLGGLASGAVPIVAAVTMRSAQGRHIPGFYVREEIKTHGLMKRIEGHIEDGSKVIILDDVTTVGDSVMKAVEEVRTRHCTVVKILSIVDRQEGAVERFKREGIDFVSIFTTKDLIP
jgi:orotate phosphoribosyltransferase